MATIKETRDKLRRVMAFIEKELPDIARNIAANDLKALIVNRVIEKGTDAKGKRFSPYSERKVSPKRFLGKSRTTGAERIIERRLRDRGSKDYQKPLSYKEFRVLNNLNINIKNFEFTGDMWKGFGVISFSAGGATFNIKMGGATASVQKKIDANSEREGVSIIEPTPKEISLYEQSLKAAMTDNILKILS